MGYSNQFTHVSALAAPTKQQNESCIKKSRSVENERVLLFLSQLTCDQLSNPMLSWPPRACPGNQRGHVGAPNALLDDEKAFVFLKLILLWLDNILQFSPLLQEMALVVVYPYPTHQNVTDCTGFCKKKKGGCKHDTSGWQCSLGPTTVPATKNLIEYKCYVSGTFGSPSFIANKSSVILLY